MTKMKKTYVGYPDNTYIAVPTEDKPREYDKGYQNGYDAGYKREMLDYGLEDDKPCEDAVSRQAVLDGVDRYIYKSQSTGTQDDFYSFAELVVKALPPVTPKPRWIPVDYDRYPETYPKAFQEVWVTDANDQVYHMAYNGTRNIKAWMLYVRPEPYKEGE